MFLIILKAGSLRVVTRKRRWVITTAHATPSISSATSVESSLSLRISVTVVVSPSALAAIIIIIIIGYRRRVEHIVWQCQVALSSGGHRECSQHGLLLCAHLIHAKVALLLVEAIVVSDLVGATSVAVII